ncbi:hypothetical protein SPRG_14711 [Saprolegnia parasitica CBS 223.65]|uniref:Uncharacterized protein n=1 Tax=Saprolegnia parasitica (strain CBS 223.65) TaxID=695850 RepID=A0A067BLG5_SAPPC|nr:hypothetical protein SPRG_14711 [Saprolegnia parasitica CBS 223.65]KDO19319.1 hypothetical protein SPRG_14711 [Saprolegnia parasitica CBS 223.65]|eukprot:XP_012209993.1 hypothetical protein SPRG_14711 [Saprolegnia parasitica CBS 223.65]
MTMASVGLTSALLAASIVGFQYGVYEDIRFRFLEARALKLVQSSTWRDSVYVFPPGFRPIYDCKEPTMAVTFLSPYVLGLPRGTLSDARLPLHFAIYEGDTVATQRIVAWRPDLCSSEAIADAFYEAHLRSPNIAWPWVSHHPAGMDWTPYKGFNMSFNQIPATLEL